MAPKEPTRQQYGKLAYSQDTPNFLTKLKNKIAGIEEDEDDEDPAYEWDGQGRAPIPRRPAMPQRPEGDHGSEDEDDGDEKPQVVVLREGKHLTEREAENARRKEKGLKPLPEPVEAKPVSDVPAVDPPKEKQQMSSLSFSSGSKAGPKSMKRKAVGNGSEEPGETKGKKKKPKKESKKLLSFGDDA